MESQRLEFERNILLGGLGLEAMVICYLLFKKCGNCESVKEQASLRQQAKRMRDADNEPSGSLLANFFLRKKGKRGGRVRGRFVKRAQFFRFFPGTLPLT